jgi:predicted permease
MRQLVYIFINIILPVFIQIGLGYLVQKKFKIGVDAQVKILLYIIIPAVLFTNIYHSSVESNISISIVVYAILHFFLLFALGKAVSKLSGFDGAASGSFTNSVMFYNSANYCLPLVELIYGDPYAVSLLVILIMVSSTMTYSVGVLNASMGHSDLRRSLMNMVRLPLLYSIASALLLRWLNISLWAPIDSALRILRQGLVPISLTTLGAQLALTSFSLKSPRVYLSNFIRLIISPVIAFAVIRLIGLEGLAAQVLLISSAAPTAVNTIILSIEFKNEPVFTSRAVFSSTVLSAFTVSAVIYFATNFL